MLSKSPIDGIRELAEEYTTTTFFTILANEILLNLASQGGEAPYGPWPKIGAPAPRHPVG